MKLRRQGMSATPNSGSQPTATASRGAFEYSASRKTGNERAYDLSDSKISASTNAQRHSEQKWPRYAQVFFRSIGLQSFNLLPWRRNTEPAKIAVEKSRWTVLIRSFVHLPPLAGCVVLLYLTSTTTIVEPNSAFASLQFTAKLHEVLMQASIAAILLSHVRYEITQNGRVPFGSLFAPAQISSIGFIWSAEMVGTMKSKGMGSLRKFALVLHIFFAVILAVAVGPSSAILMIPRPIHPLLGQCTVTLPTTVDSLYPSELTLQNPGRADFASVRRVYENIDGQDLLYDAGDTTEASLGASIDDSICSRMLNYFAYRTASAPLQLTADAIQACSITSWNNRLSGQIDDCGPVPIIGMNSSSQLHLATQMEDSTYPQLNITLGEFNDSYNQTNTSHILWASLPNEHDYASSIVAVVAPDISDVGVGVPWYWTCSAVATWQPATVNNSKYNQIQAYPTGDEAKLDNMMPNVTNVISIDPAWAYNATENGNLFNDFIGSTTLSELLDLSYSPLNHPWDGTGDFGEPSIDNRIIGGIIATAISSALTVNALNITYANITYKRTNATVPQGIWMPNINSRPQLIANAQTPFPPGTISDEEVQLLAAQDPTRSFVIDVLRRSLIGYAFETVPVILATVAICLYCFYVLVALCASIIIGISSNSWDSASELTALALNSNPPSHLGSISAGLNTLRVFQEPVGIFTNENDGLELVFTEGNSGLDNYKVIETNKEY